MRLKRFEKTILLLLGPAHILHNPVEYFDPANPIQITNLTRGLYLWLLVTMVMWWPAFWPCKHYIGSMWWRFLC